MGRMRKTILLLLLFFPLMAWTALPEEEEDVMASTHLRMPKIQRKKEFNKNVPFSLSQYATPLIILDPGHGGTDEGAKVGSLLEKKITLTTTMLTKKHLDEMGYRVLLTRSKDVFISLNRRAEIANLRQAALFVSIHYNASKSHAAKGVEVFFCDSKELWRRHASKRLANCILNHVLDQTEASSRGVKGGNFFVIRETDMPAVLVEGGFVTNKEERALLKDREYLDRIGRGIAEGIDKFLKS